ncbi:MAG: histidine triad nucleotide-binding protein [Oscillospiraceae bacterium]|nr:histidine triad nucleotide-binding protein [Oscillospiraceae bacterium]MCD7749415.1 histidine triad nucleotide-binding protein [Oscillospiraceae bacterium]
MSMVINADSDCLFCNIIEGKIPSTKVYEDDYCYAFRDIAPQAPTHILVIPKEHIPSADALDSGNSSVAARCLEAIPKIAKGEGLENGYRIISNVGPDAGQSVQHLHFHLLGGKRMPDQMI